MEEIKTNLSLEDEKDGSERRVYPRKEVRVNKVFLADLTVKSGETHQCRLYIADVSEGGFKITSDFPFEKGVHITVTLYSQVPFTFIAEIAWAKELGAGMKALGLMFVDIDKENKDILDSFIAYYTSKELSKVYRLNKVIPMRIQYGTLEPEPFYILTLEISLTGMKIAHETRLPEGEKISFNIYLDPHAKPLEVFAHIISQKEEGSLSENYIINLEFIDMSKEAKEFLNSFIDNAISNLIEKKISRPVVVFDVDS